ncbi:Arylacetonitrilase [Zalerion maritima]|uniref:nitrilase n=1 Tax=Zalerion maritima TaxID=339359 RepID=A0AAD5RL31_9PEZI|nr:Arylacetonitrilase [Zalerion maritima]
MAVLKVAVVQAESEWLDLAAAITKACKLIGEAADGGARLVAFSECWITGYPAWIWARPIDLELSTKYTYNSLPVESPEMEQLKAAAKENNIAVAMGFSERSPTDSVYISQAIISPQGELAMHRRKIKPTHMERTIFGDGSGRDLENVVEIDFAGQVGKVKVGCLACWEHTQPLLKYHTYSLGETVHVAMWPPLYPARGVADPGLWSMTADGCLGLSQTYAVEGAAYVVHATGVCKEKGVEMFGTKGGPVCGEPGGGQSCVVGPDGRRITDPLGGEDDQKGTSEGIVFADLDLSRVVTTKGFLDVVGHYSRPDLLWLGVDKRQKVVVDKTI